MKTAFERYRQGESAAIHEVVGAYAATAYSLAVAVLGDRALAERAVQDAFIKVAEQASEFDPVRDEENAWILLRVRAQALSMLRQQARYRGRRDLTATVPAEIVPREDGVWRAVMSAANPPMVRGAVDELTEAQRETLTLAYWKGLRPEEISKQRGVPEEIVRENLRAALQRVRDVLAQQTRETFGP
jgi:RNA polymerase sigma-70 factor (ECF subfamily)